MISQKRRVTMIVIFSVWITLVASAPSQSQGSRTVPEINGCSYVDAYMVTCGWDRPAGDSDTIYRLGHTSDSYHPEERVKYCETVDATVTHSGTVSEECGFPATMFQMSTFWVEIMTISEGEYVSTGVRSLGVEFTAEEKHVKLTVPPESLDVDGESMTLVWSVPDKDGSFLGFIVVRKFFYKLEYKRHCAPDEDWEVFYRGFERHAHFPELKSGASYDFRAFASLRRKSDVESSSEESIESEWSMPSAVLVYVAVAPLGSQEDDTYTISDCNIMKANDIPIESRISRHPHRYVTVVAIVTACVTVLVASIILLGYVLYWKGYCCFEVKFIKPNALIKIDADLEPSHDQDKESWNNKPSNQIAEKVYPVTLNNEFEWIVDELWQKPKSQFTIAIPNEIPDNDLRQNIVRSFHGIDGKENSPCDETRFTVSAEEIDSDLIKSKMKQRQEFVSKDSLNSIQYMKLVENHTAMPPYLLTDSEEKDLSIGSSDSIDTEYVMEYTTVSSSAPMEMAVRSLEENPHCVEFRSKTAVDKSQFASDNLIPDYVIQASVSYDDFADTMTSFLHRLTQAEAWKDNLTEDDSTHEMTASPLEGDTISRGRAKHCSSVSAANRITRHDCCASNQAETTSKTRENHRTTQLNRSGSASLPSIDSGYSAETPDSSLTVAVAN